MASRKELIFGSYRRLYRARRGLFRNDTHAMRESRVAVREQYLQHNGRVAATTMIPDDEFYNLLSMVDEAVDMMKHGIAQGSLNQNTGRYEVKLTKDHVAANTGDTGQPPLVEPITLQTVQGLEKQREPVQVTTTTTTTNTTN